MRDSPIEPIAAELIRLHENGSLSAPFSARYTDLTPEDGYRAAAQLHAHRVAQGWKPVGRKIGFTNRTIWKRYGVYEPMWGMVYDRTLLFSQKGRARVALAGLVQPRIEPEICLRLASAPPRGTRDPHALLAAIESAARSAFGEGYATLPLRLRSSSNNTSAKLSISPPTSRASSPTWCNEKMCRTLPARKG